MVKTRQSAFSVRKSGIHLPSSSQDKPLSCAANEDGATPSASTLASCTADQIHISDARNRSTKSLVNEEEEATQMETTLPTQWRIKDAPDGHDAKRPKRQPARSTRLDPKEISKMGGEPNQTTVIARQRMPFSMQLKPRQRLIMTGQHDIWVQRGSVTVMGALLHASSRIWRVSGPSTHSLPVIEHAENPFGPVGQIAQLVISACTSQLLELKSLHPSFKKAWSPPISPPPASVETHTGAEGHSSLPNNPLQMLPEWRRLLIRLAEWHAHEAARPLVIMVCGAKGAGKSTLMRCISNHLLSATNTGNGMALLDLDPGQPEFSGPGIVSLHHLRSCWLGPPSAHPSLPPSGRNRTLRAHYLGSNSPRYDTGYYMRCVANLYSSFTTALGGSKCPLVISTSGWVEGRGTEILQEILQLMPVSDVIQIGEAAASESFEALQRQAEARSARVHILASASQPSRHFSASTLRTMQMMSYFHIESTLHEQPVWFAEPLQLRPPTRLSYGGESPLLQGLICLESCKSREAFDLTMIGSTMGLIALGKTHELFRRQSQDFMDLAYVQRPRSTNSPFSDDQQQSARFDVAESYQSQLETREPIPLPLLQSLSDHPLFIGPERSQCLGQVLIMGIDEEAGDLLVSTPIDKASMEALVGRNMNLLLVMGSMGSAEWVFTEAVHFASYQQRVNCDWARCAAAGEEEVQSDDQAPAFWVPYVQRLHSSRSKTAVPRGGKVWRVRRNLEVRPQ